MRIFTTERRGLVPASGSSTSFLRGDGEWIDFDQSLVGTTIEQDLGGPVGYGKFTVTDEDVSEGDFINIQQAPGPYTGKGDRADESEMDRLDARATASDGEFTVNWTAQTRGARLAGEEPPFTMLPFGKVKGNFKFNYQRIN